MIIVSQNEKNIINFDNSVGIRYNDFSKISGGHEIYALGNRENIFIGEYSTEERAKEVLQEIIEIHRVSIPTAVYEMPKE